MRAYEHELPWSLLDGRLGWLDLTCQTFDYENVLEMLASLVQEYTPTKYDDCDLLWHPMVKCEHHDVVAH